MISENLSCHDHCHINFAKLRTGGSQRGKISACRGRSTYMIAVDAVYTLYVYVRVDIRRFTA